MLYSRNYYEILSVSSTATADDIRHAYRRAAKKAHPDIGGSEGAMDRVNEAYHILSDLASRREYDEQRNAPQAGPQNDTFMLRTSRAAEAAAAAAHNVRLILRRRAAARSLAWRLIRVSGLISSITILLVHYVGYGLANSLSKLVFATSAFIPVYLLALGFVFLFDPELRLDIHDITHHRRLAHRADAAALLGMIIAFVLLGVIWVRLLSGVY